MTRRLCGYDVNGWRDLHARSWQLTPGEEAAPDGRHCSAPLALPDVVRAGIVGREWIGGAQAALAPHGRGGGWGALGAADNRVAVRALLAPNAPEGAPARLAAAFDGMAHGAQTAVAAIDDLPDADEAVQDRLLDAMAGLRIANRLLVWRPVLAALHAISQGLVADGASVGVINHCSDGATVQRLRIRREAGRSGSILAPERRQAGRLIRGDWGYAGLLRRAVAEVTAVLPMQWRLDALLTRAVGQLALGLPAEREVMRLENRDWAVLNPPRSMEPPSIAINAADLAPIRDCDLIVFESLTEGRIRGDLLAAFVAALGRDPVDAPIDAIALGALTAAERVARREPVYFDFLPVISTIVVGTRETRNFDLIKADETLPAGQVYRSPEPAPLLIPANHAMLSIYLAKQNEPRPREATIKLEPAMREDTRVLLTVEQTPAAGRARILLDAPSVHRRFEVDWSGARELPGTWDDLIAGLQPALPVVPDRLVLPCSAEMWEDGPRRNGLAGKLRRMASGEVNWRELATSIAAAQGGVHCISSDGELPAEIDARTRAMLDDLTARAVRAVFDPGAEDRNHALKFVSWQFKRCPQTLVEAFLQSWEMEEAGGSPFLDKAPARVLRYQAVGRIVRAEADELRAMAMLLARPFANWHIRDETACAAFILSRSETAAARLTRRDVDRLATHAATTMDDCRGTAIMYLMYPARLAAGLLRWRQAEPFALVKGADPAADRLVASIEAAEAALHALPQSASARRTLDAFEMLRLAFEGAGQPGILRAMYADG